MAALIPLTMMWFGIDETQKVMFIFIACVPFIFSDTVSAIAGVPDRYVETAQTLGASELQIVGKVLVPLALPEIYNGLRHLFGLAFGYIMLAEVVNAEHGLGQAADGQPAAVDSAARHPDPDHRQPAGVRNRSPAALVPARAVPLSHGRIVTTERPAISASTAPLTAPARGR